MLDFNHLHCHTQFSLLDGAASISGMMQKAQHDGMKAVALTDHGNMFGAFKFVAEASKYNVKPIVGCEFYVVEDRHKKQFSKEDKDNRFHQLMLAKNATGYKNLSKLTSLGYMEGMYSKWPRIDKELIEKYHEGIIATSCCLAAEIPQAILNKGEEEAEELLKWWIDLFGEDFYIELQRHELDEQKIVNEVLLKFAKKYHLKIIATNDSHYVDQEDSTAHDILLCVNTGELQSKPVWKGSGFGGKDYRFGFPNNEFYFKTQNEMNTLFSDVPVAIDNTNEIVDKVEHLKLERDILLPNFPLPPEFTSEDEYLKHLTFEGAKSPKRYGEITAEIEERINHELGIIKTMGFAGYFLITADMINAGRDLGVMIGPGRGSAAGSVVAYALGITNIDPIKYSLLFERFLNPERISMPDIDTDFDDQGRQKVIDYVVDKYGYNQVAQIITYGTMAAKMAIKDVARVRDLPLSEANALAKLVPEMPGTTLEKAFNEVSELGEIRKQKSEQGLILEMAQKLEGSVRNTGIHAAGVIIAPDDLTNYIPVSTSKDSNLLVTQYDGKVIESAGMLKMDFLGLKTLTIIKDALALIKKNRGVDIDIDNINLEDEKTFALYQRGDTIGTFQFESTGMRKYLQILKPTNIEDLIAMNALYRPGPMEFIPNFINRKHGREKVEYPHELLEPILKNSYGIMVYQEQIMQTAQIMAGYSLGQADLLRRAMGKKKLDEMAKQREVFVAGAKEKHNIDRKKAEEIFAVMEKFAAYGFNRSHSAAYSVVAYQTAYLKAHYPSEYMASVLTHNQNNIDKITFFLDECRKQNIPVLGPHINESSMYFDVNKEGKIRFGLGAIKGTGEAAVEAIISERDEHGSFKDIFDFAERINLRAVNKKTFESLAMGGAFDCFKGTSRRQYLFQEGEQPSGIELAVRYGNSFQNDKNASQHSLFGGDSGVEIPKPKLPQCEPYSEIEKLKIEKDVVGFYISGHPLDQYKVDIENFCTCTLDQYKEHKNQVIRLAGIVTKFVERTSKRGAPFGLFSIEDYNDTIDVAMFGEDYMKHRHLLQVGGFVYMIGKVEERYNQEGEWEFRPRVIQLLSNIREDLSKEIQVNVDVTLLNEELVNQLEMIAKENPGKCKFVVTLYSAEESMKVELLSKRYMVNPNNHLIEGLTLLDTVSYKIVSDKIDLPADNRPDFKKYAKA
ncbi:MAG: DNA polymerase III subunit alpha [Cyclobacteriaceae bacterium]|nr:DNA polymerase III subunit alpha [Cyclobacteriaceae bacterium]